MFFAAPIRSLDDIARLRRARFDFGEIAVTNAGARRMWWEKSVTINPENLPETAKDLKPVISEVADLRLTQHAGHANLNGSANKSISIIEKLGKSIRHVNLHDNLGGQSKADDLHLPLGDGSVDFKAIMAAEVKPEFQEPNRNSIEDLVTATADD